MVIHNLYVQVLIALLLYMISLSIASGLHKFIIFLLRLQRNRKMLVLSRFFSRFIGTYGKLKEQIIN